MSGGLVDGLDGSEVIDGFGQAEGWLRACADAGAEVFDL